MSLTANISVASTLTLPPILEAGWPPVALLLTVELLAQSPRSRQYTETELTASKTEQAAGIVEAGTESGTAAPMVVRVSETGIESGDESEGETAQVITFAGV